MNKKNPAPAISPPDRSPPIIRAIEDLASIEPIKGEPLKPVYDPLPESDLRCFPKQSPEVIGICGLPRAGKDVVADYLSAHYRNVVRIAFSDAILVEVNEHLAAIGLSHRITAENKSERPYRRLLQEWGMKRAEDEPDYWTSRTLRAARESQRAGKRLIITGLRLPQDVSAVRYLGGQIWEVKRPGNDYQAEHAIEDQLGAVRKDQTIVNGTEGDLRPFELNIEAALYAGSAI